MKKKIEQFDLIGNIKRYFEIRPYRDIISWAKQNIDFSQQISAERNKLDFDLYPYQIPVLKEWQNNEKVIKTIVVVAPEQTGKTNMFIDGLLWNMQFCPCQSMIVYPSDGDAIAANQTKLLPLMKHIPILKREFENKRCYTRDSYRFSNLISYFQGAGSKIISKSCKIVIGDEVDAWPTLNGIDNVADLKKRTRSYNSSICFLISSPTVEEGRIWQQFLKGSQGYWYLRCKGCGQLTMRSCDIKNLQFQSDLDEATNQRTVREGSCRLICPECKFEHTEDMKRWMNINGGYKHAVEKRKVTSPSFQIGALASQLPSLSWQRIAEKQLEAGKRADIEAHITFDNSIRGLPYKRRQIVKEDLQRVRDHQYRDNEGLHSEQIEFIFCTFDTMDQYFRYGVFASDVNDNIHVIKFGETKYLYLNEDERQKINSISKEEAYLSNKQFIPVETVEDIIDKQYYGFRPILSVIDCRGHMTKVIQKFVSTHMRVAGWYGGKVVNPKNYKPSQIKRSFIVSAQHYKVDAIWYLYTQKNRKSEYLFFYKNVEDKYIEQISAMKPDYNRNNGNIPQNWTVENRADHTFDVIKMAYFTRDFCIDKDNIGKDKFNYCKSPRLKRQYEQQINNIVNNAKKQIVQTNTNKKKWLETPNNGWFKI